jgi:hypothetical protein
VRIDLEVKEDKVIVGVTMEASMEVREEERAIGAAAVMVVAVVGQGVVGVVEVVGEEVCTITSGVAKVVTTVVIKVVVIIQHSTTARPRLRRTCM